LQVRVCPRSAEILQPQGIAGTSRLVVGPLRRCELLNKAAEIPGVTNACQRSSRHPLQLYPLAKPNGVKAPVMLEEMLALGYGGEQHDAWLIRRNDGDQFVSGFVGANPNSKIPAFVDHGGATPVRVFESGRPTLVGNSCKTST